MRDSTAPVRRGPIGDRLRAGAQRPEADRGVAEPATSAAAPRQPIGERLRARARERPRDEDVRALAAESVLDGADFLGGALLDRTSEVAIDVAEAIGEALIEALWD